MENDKYVVFKRDDIDKVIAAREGTPYVLIEDVMANALDDAIVIRKQDVFAASALYAYANAIQTAIEILIIASPLEKPVPLERLRDFFFEQAEEARTLTGTKVPD